MRNVKRRWYPQPSFSNPKWTRQTTSTVLAQKNRKICDANALQNPPLCLGFFENGYSHSDNRPYWPEVGTWKRNSGAKIRRLIIFICMECFPLTGGLWVLSRGFFLNLSENCYVKASAGANKCPNKMLYHKSRGIDHTISQSVHSINIIRVTMFHAVFLQAPVVQV